MTEKMEYQGGDQTQAGQMIEFIRQMPNTFIPIGDLQQNFGWSFVSTLDEVVKARRLLITDALYIVRGEAGFVYETKRVAVGERLIPSKFRPDPAWLSEFPKRQDLRNLLQRVRYADVVSDTEAEPPLTPDEHLLLMWFVANNVEQHVFTVSRLSQAVHIPKEKISSLVSDINQKFTVETRGEWVISSERRSGLCYMLKHNGI